MIQKESELKEARDALLAINPMLEKYGVLKGKLTAENLNSTLVKQSLEANQEIQELSPTNIERRKKATVTYFLKDVDQNIVEEALRDFGFKLSIKSPIRPDLPTNNIAFGGKVAPEDAKLVAYTLIRAGIQIKALCRSSLTNNELTIQAFGDDRLLDKPALTVEEINSSTDFIYCPADNVPWP